jgi:hypothetical protein
MNPASNLSVEILADKAKRSGGRVGVFMLGQNLVRHDSATNFQVY